jgi:PhnB protein
MPMVTPNFHFDGRCRQAIGLYERALGARVISLLCYSDANPLDWKKTNQEQSGLVYHAELMIGTQRVMMSDTTDPAYPAGNSLSLVVTFDCADEVSKAYDILSQGAKLISPMQSTTYSSCFVSLIDRFGMRWELMTEQTDR